MIYEIPKDAIIESIDSDFEQDTMIGLCIKTNKGDIKLLIAADQSCCENFGNLFFDTPDPINNFIGSTLLEVKNIDVPNGSYLGYGLDDGNETQLRITTSKGVLQYAIYNSHNGYYGHCTFQQVFEKINEAYI